MQQQQNVWLIWPFYFETNKMKRKKVQHNQLDFIRIEFRRHILFAKGGKKPTCTLCRCDCCENSIKLQYHMTELKEET